ncbi:hypothetical protein ABZU76_27780 [Amycolatopsis sp. NPDC005232]|uniref:hypothetical protein n=1 Tax=Amycolatopsis sp. NPDC005232 TaxID=3157027 RepID=UPI0033AFA335
MKRVAAAALAGLAVVIVGVALLALWAAAGYDSAHFATAKPAEQLSILVYVAAPISDETASCAITYDGRVIAGAEPVPLEHTNTLACRVRLA